MSTTQVIRDRIAELSWHGAYLLPEEAVALDREFDALLHRIKACPDYASAETALVELSEMEDLFALLLCKYNLKLSDKQKRLCREFDRYDDPETRYRFYQDVKEGRFS